MIKKLDPFVIRHINLSSNKLGIDAVKNIVKILEISRSVHTINLEKCHLPRNGVMSLCEGVKLNISIENLIVTHNSIDDSCADSLAAMISEATSLNVLDLNFNNIRGEGGVKIFNALAWNKQLKELNLGWNSMGD